MGSRRSPSAPQWQLILEEIRSQNRATLEELLSFRQSIEERVERLDRDSRGRDEVLALAVRSLQQEVSRHSSDLTELKRLALRHGADIAELKALGERSDGRLAGLEEGVEGHTGPLLSLTGQVSSLEARFSVLEGLSEQQLGRLDALEELGRQHGGDLRDSKLSVQENTLEIKALAQKVDALHRLDERVAALEKKVGAAPPSA